MLNPKLKSNPPRKNKRNRRNKRIYKYRSLLVAALFSSSSLLPLFPVLAASPAPGTIIDNQATGSFTDPNDGDKEVQIESNVVEVEVAEVAGITISQAALPEEAPSGVSGAGANQGNGDINADDIIYFTYKITNVGNDPTQFFIPDAPSNITNGTLNGNIQIIEYDPDGASAVDLTSNNITVPNNGDTTGNLLNGVTNTNDGSVPVGGSITIRVPVKADSTLTDGDKVTVVMGDTTATDGQNESYVAGNKDVYTQDNSGTANGDTDGSPIEEREASLSQEATVIAASPTTVSPTAACPAGVYELINIKAVNNSYESGPSDLSVGRVERFTNVTTMNGQTLDLLIEIVAITNNTANSNNKLLELKVLPSGAIKSTMFADDPPNSTADSQDPIGTRRSYELKYTFVTSGTTTPVNVSFEVEIGDIDNYITSGTSKEARNEYVQFSTTEVDDFFLSSSPATQLQSIAINGGTGVEVSNTVQTSSNPGNNIRRAVKLQLRDISSFNIVYGAEKNSATKEVGNTGFEFQALDPMLLGTCPRYDYGDAPDTGSGTGTGNYETLQANSGPYHKIVDGVYLGSQLPDADNDGIPTTNATGDDNVDLSTGLSNTGFDDEDGVKIGSDSLQAKTLNAGDSITLDIATAGSGKLNAWIDWNGNGDFTDTGEQIATDADVSGGTLNVTVPAGATAGTTYARFRYSTQTGLTPTGAASDGEVEDYQVEIASSSTSKDYGDAPDSYGTTNANNGASHGIVNGLHLGTVPDAETDAVTPLDGSGDGAEDDGITLLPLTAGSTGYAITPSDITATGTGTLHAWVDFDKNGTFDQSEYTSVAINNGTPDPEGLTWRDISVGSTGNTYARFRFTTDSNINANTPGGAASDGEVEDYQVTITSASPNQTIDDTPSATSCPVQGGALLGPNIFTPYDNGTFGFEDGSATQSPATNPYSGITNGDYAQYKSRPNDSSFEPPGFGEYSFVANIVVARNRFQHEPVTDPVYGVTGRFFATDPDIDSIPELGTTLTGLTPNQFYEVSFWAANSEPNGTPNTIDIFIDGQSVYSTGELPAVPAALAWKKHTFTFTNGSKNSIDLRIKSTEAGRGGLDFYLDNIEMRECNFAIDYGDAPSSYGDALHTTIPPAPKLYLGSVAPDSETATPLGGDAGVGADGDDASPNDDEDAFTTLPSIPTTGTYDLNNIPVNNTTGGDATLHAWVDFNQNGKFEAGEYQSTTINNGATTANLSWTVPGSITGGDTYARFRLTSNPLSDDTGTTDIDERSKDAVIAGEVEDYSVAIASDPNVLLVKRITKVNSNTTTKDGDDLSIYNQDNSNPYDDNKLDNPAPDPVDTDKWVDTTSDTSSTFLIGGINGGKVEPDDELEYTIYYLSAGDSEAKSVLLCDRVPSNTTFIPTAFNSEPNQATGGLNSDRGILWNYDGNIQSLSNAQDGDKAQYFPPGVDPKTVYPNVKCDGENTNGAVVVNLGNLPNATAPGTPTGSYGFVRFRGKVK